MKARAAAAVLVFSAAIAGLVWFFLSQKTEAPRPTPIDASRPAEEAATGSRPGSPSPAISVIQPKPFGDEPDPEAAERTSAGRTLVEVVNADAAPVAGASVMPHTPRDEWWRASPQPGSAKTRPDGTVRIDVGIETHLIVTAPGHPPVMARIDDRAHIRATLPGEPTVRANVRVDGVVPTERLRLILRGYDDPTGAWPESARAIASEQGFGELRMPVETDASGTLTARGAGRGTSVTLELPEGYVLAEPRDRETREVPVVANGETMTIDLARMHAITGTVAGNIVDPNQGNRSPDGSEVRYVLDRIGGPPITGHAVVRKRAFRIFFIETPLTRGVFEVWDQWRGRKLAEHVVDGPISRSIDVGEIRLRGAPRTVLFHVVNDAGRPLSGGRVLAAGFASSKSDADGRTSLPIPDGTTFIVAGAPGHKIVRIALPAELPESMNVRLEPGATLIVRVRHEDPTVSLDGLRLAISYDVDDASGPADSSGEFQDVRITKAGGSMRMSVGGMSAHGRFEGGGRQTHHYDVEAGKDIAVGGFKKGDEVQVKVEDQYEHACIEQTIKFTEDEPKPIELVIRSRPQRLRVVVRDHQDRPLPGARVSNGSPFMRMFARQTDAEGVCEIAQLFGLETSVTVEASGHVSKFATLPVSEKLAEVRLERARNLTVEIIGPSAGSPPVAVHFATDDGSQYGASPRGQSFYTLDGIPCRPGTITAKAGDSTSTLPIGAEETRVRLARPR